MQSKNIDLTKIFILGLAFVLLSAVSIASPLFAFGSDGDASEAVLVRDAADEGDAPAPAETETRGANDVVYEIETPEVPAVELPALRTWALMNFLIALVCFVVSAVTIIALPATNRRVTRYAMSDEYGDYRNFVSKDLLVFRLLGSSVGIAALVLFSLTENMHGAMRLVNGYTWLMALILFAQFAILLMASGREKRLEHADDMTDFLL
jgi:hypothetical protein